MKRLNVIDLFAGAGGLSEGILQSENMNILAHVEWEKPMVDVLRYRLSQKWGESIDEAKTKVIHFDIQRTEELLDGHININDKFAESNSKIFLEGGLHKIIGDNKVDVVVGGPPCQAYSIAGRAQDKNGMKEDYRNYLFMSFAKVVSDLKPKVFVFENVPGILSAKPHGINVTEEIYNEFEKIGYQILDPEHLKNAVFNTAYFGVPQSRRRVVIFGVRKGSKVALDSLYDTLRSFEDHEHIATVRDAIGDFPKIYPLDEPIKVGKKNQSHELIHCDMTGHVARFTNKKNQQIFREWVEDNLNTLSTEEKNAYYFKKTGHKSNHPKYRSLNWNEPSPTVVAHLYKDGYMFIHPDSEQARSITIREAATLMGFPKDYQFDVTESYAFKMIGNAVPVGFAKYIGLTLHKVLDN